MIEVVLPEIGACRRIKILSYSHKCSIYRKLNCGYCITIVYLWQMVDYQTNGKLLEFSISQANISISFI